MRPETGWGAADACGRRPSTGKAEKALRPRRWGGGQPFRPSPPREEGWLRTLCGCRRPPRQQCHRRDTTPSSIAATTNRSTLRTTSSRPAPPPPRTSEAPRPPGSVDLLRPPISGRWGIRVSERPDGRSVGIPTLPPGRGGPRRDALRPETGWGAADACGRRPSTGKAEKALRPRRWGGGQPFRPSPPREEGWLRTLCGRRRGGAQRQCPPHPQRHRRDTTPSSNAATTNRSTLRDNKLAPRPTSSQNLGGTPPPGAGRAKKRRFAAGDGVGRCGRLRTQTEHGEGPKKALRPRRRGGARPFRPSPPREEGWLRTLADADGAERNANVRLTRSVTDVTRPPLRTRRPRTGRHSGTTSSRPAPPPPRTSEAPRPPGRGGPRRDACGRRRGGAQRQCPPHPQRHRRDTTPSSNAATTNRSTLRDNKLAPRPTSSRSRRGRLAPGLTWMASRESRRRIIVA